MTEPVSIIIIIIIVIIVIIIITGEPGRRQAGRGARAGQGRQALLWRLRGPRPVRSVSIILSVSINKDNGSKNSEFEQKIR